MNHQPSGWPLTPCRCSGLLARPLARQRGTPGAGGAPHGALGAATLAGETRPLLRGLRKAIPPNPHGGPGRWAPSNGLREKLQSKHASPARGWMDGGMDAPRSSRAPRMRCRRSGAQGSALVPPSSRAGPAPAACRSSRTSARTPHLLLFRCQNQKSPRGVRSEWRVGSEAKTSLFKLPVLPPPELGAGTGGTSHPELPEGLPALEVGPSPSCKCLFLSYRALGWVSSK